MKEGTKKTFEGGIIGGDYARAKNPAFLAERAAKWAVLWARQEADFAARPREAIAITMPDGKVKEGTSWETTPMDIAKGISSQMAKKQIVAEVIYTGVRHGSTAGGAAALDEAFESDEVEGKGEMWDLTRPLEGDCKLFLRDFNDRDAKAVFWHSSAHVLGECIECELGAQLTVGPPVENGFFYDCYMGDGSLTEGDYKPLEKKATAIIKEKQTFERLFLTKDEALELFSDNPFKVNIITTKVPDGGTTSAYKCGELMDLCLGPHIVNTGLIKAFKVEKHSSAYYGGKAENDSLQVKKCRASERARDARDKGRESVRT